MISKHISHSEKQTEKISGQIAKKLKGGETIALIGNLGAGKTVFVRGLALVFGIKKTITSPTFVLLKPYQIKDHRFKVKELIHVDAYRLKNEKDLIDIGIKNWLGKKDSIVVIEWAEKVKKLLPKNVISITIKVGKKENERYFLIK